MINGLKNFTEKSFIDYTTSITFKKNNLIFGYNGRGKSSLARGIAKEHFNNHNSDDGLQFFNNEYIEKNLLIEENNNQPEIIKGVVATFSEKDIETEKSIKVLQDEIVDTKILSAEITKLVEDIRLSINTKHDERKGKLNITKKKSNYKIKEIISIYENDIEEAKKIMSDEEKIKIQQGDDSIEREIQLLEARKKPQFSLNNITENEIEKLEEILMKSHEDNLIPTPEMVDWLNIGLSLHKHETKCNFCENSIDITLIKERIKRYNEDIKQKNITYLRNKIELLNDWIERINKDASEENLKTIYSYSQIESEKYDEVSEIIKNNLIEIVLFKERLENKISDMEIIDTESSTDFKNAITLINETNQTISNLIDEKLKVLRNQSQNQNILVKGAIGLAIKSDSLIQSMITNLTEKELEYERISQKNLEIKSQIIDLQNSDSDHEDFRLFLNEVLKDLQMDMELIPHKSGKNYSLKHSKIPDVFLTIDNISEGERNLLALLFFYYQLFEDDKQNVVKKSINTIIIDDPISSLDDANKFYVLELLKSVFENDSEGLQTFILTHKWDDFCSLSYGLKDFNNYGLYEVYKNGNSNSELREAKSSVSPYKKLFQEINHLSKKTVEEVDDCDIFHTPNSMRRVLEEFLHFKNGPEIIPTRAQQSFVENSIEECTNGKTIDGQQCSGGSYLSPSKKKKLGAMLDIINILSHDTGFNSTEVINSAKFLMKLISDMDSAHFNAMVK